MINIINEMFGIGDVFFNKTGKPIYMDNNYFKGRFFDFVNQVEKEKRKKNICIYPECTNKSIKNSHVIPKQANLKLISKNSVVYFPKYLRDTANYAFEQISINSASTFPGFCPEHEKLFFGFEQIKGEVDSSISMQNFRIICRDYFALRIRQKYLINASENYKREIFSYNSKLIGVHNEFTSENIKLQSVKDEITEDFENQLSFIADNIAEIEKDLNIYKDSYENSDDKVINYLFKFPHSLPLALAGKSSFEVHDSVNDYNKKFTIYLSIQPQKNDTILNFTFAKEYIDDINVIFANYIYDFRMLSFIESFIIYGSDYWFINPDLWGNFSKSKQERIKADLLVTTYYPTKELEYSIFDDIRKSLVEGYRENNRIDLNHKLNLEEKKLVFFDQDMNL